MLNNCLKARWLNLGLFELYGDVSLQVRTFTTATPKYLLVLLFEFYGTHKYLALIIYSHCAAACPRRHAQTDNGGTGGPGAGVPKARQDVVPAPSPALREPHARVGDTGDAALSLLAGYAETWALRSRPGGAILSDQP